MSSPADTALPRAPSAPVPSAPAPQVDAVEVRLAVLFRHSRAAGRVHVLQHLIQRYRTEGGK